MWGWIPQYGHIVFFWSTLVAAVCGGIGIGAAFISAMVGYELSEWASRDATERIAKTESDSRVAIEKAQADSTKSLAEAASANARALEAQLALEKLKAPRTLTADQQADLAKKLRSFAGQRFRAAISQAADDGPSFWKTLHATLETAGWTYVPPDGGIWIGDPPAGVPITAVPGVAIFIDPAKLTELSPAAEALGNALLAERMKVTANVSGYKSDDEAVQNTLQIVIGVRAQP